MSCQVCEKDAALVTEYDGRTGLACGQKCASEAHPDHSVVSIKRATNDKTIDKMHVLHPYVQANPWISSLLGMDRDGNVQNTDALECLSKHVQDIAGKRGQDDRDQDTDMDTQGSAPVRVDPGTPFFNPFQTPAAPSSSSAAAAPAQRRTYGEMEEEDDDEQRKRTAPTAGRFQIPTEVVQQLLETINDAGVTTMNTDANLGNLALLYSSRREQFIDAIKRQNQQGALQKVLYELTKERIRGNAMRTLEQARMMRVAALSLLLRAGIKPSYIDIDSDKTPLHWAAFYGYETLVSDMLAAGAYIDARDKQGLTPLRYAQLNNQNAASAVLALAGASA